jgi:predicted DNA-binding transcriptional regulator YafY
MPAPLRQQALAAASRFHLDAPGWFASPRLPPHLEALAAGVFGDRVVRARYRGKAGPRECQLEPLGLVLKAGTWYVIGREAREARESGAVRGYRADRFQRVTVTGQRFARPSGFDLGAFWATWREEFERGLPVVMVTVRARPGCIGRLRRSVEPAHAGKVGWDTPPDDTGSWLPQLAGCLVCVPG